MRIVTMLSIFFSCLSLTHAYQLGWKEVPTVKRTYQSERAFKITSQYYASPIRTVKTTITESVTGINKDGTTAVTRQHVADGKQITQATFDRRMNGAKLNYKEAANAPGMIAMPFEGETLHYMTSLYFPEKDLVAGDKWEQDIPIMLPGVKTPPMMKASYSYVGSKDINGKSYLQITMAISDTHVGIKSVDSAFGNNTYDVETKVDMQLLWDVNHGEVYSADIKSSVKVTTLPQNGAKSTATTDTTDKLVLLETNAKDSAVIRLTTAPAGVTVFIDGIQQMQVTPCMIIIPFPDAMPHIIKLEIRREGYRSIIANGTLKPGETKDFTLTMKPLE
jgi:hypothetical protein